MGMPGSKEFSANEIFSGYTVWLSKLRLKEVGLYNEYSEQYHDSLKRHETKAGLIKFKNEFRGILYDAAEPFFTWEKAVGMCPVCFGFWISLITGICFTQNVVNCLTIVVVSHVTIRLLNKIL